MHCLSIKCTFMARTFFTVFLVTQFKNLYSRKVVYLFLAPAMAAYLSLSLSLNSYSFLFITAISYFFVLDAIAIPGSGIITDISKFYAAPISLTKIYLTYIRYRLFNGFILNYLPSLLVFVLISSMLIDDDMEHIRIDISILIFSIAWVVYIIATIPMLILAFRKKAFYQLYSLFAFPFYSIGIIIQLEINWKLVVMRDYLFFVWVVISIVFITIGVSFIQFLKNEILYPERQNGKLGF